VLKIIIPLIKKHEEKTSFSLNLLNWELSCSIGSKQKVFSVYITKRKFFKNLRFNILRNHWFYFILFFLNLISRF
jgi:hypothetical protein